MILYSGKPVIYSGNLYRFERYHAGSPFRAVLSRVRDGGVVIVRTAELSEP